MPFNVLILGSDARPNQPLKGSRSDSIILVKVVPLLAKVEMVSIPRDTYTEVECGKVNKKDKITHAFAFGGTKCTKKAVENLLNTKINYTALFRFSDVIALTDIIGGVNIVANHSFVQDNQKFVEGQTYNIKGEQALAYARHRKTDSAFKRDERQRQIIQAIAKKMVSPIGIIYIPSVLSYSQQKMEVYFNPIRVISMIPAVVINGAKLNQNEIKGNGKMMKGVYYFIPEEQSLQEAKNKFKVYF